MLSLIKRHRVAKFPADQRGVSAVEFALVSPLLILMFFGMFEISSAVMAQRRTSHADSSIGDLTAQFSTMSPNQLADIFYGAGLIVAPYSSSSLQLRLSSIIMDSNSVPRISWSCTPTGQTGLNPIPALTSVTSTIPTGLVSAPGDSVIMSESAYVYTSPLTYVIKNAINFNNTFYYKPRQSTSVAFTAAPASATVSCVNGTVS